MFEGLDKFDVENVADDERVIEIDVAMLQDQDQGSQDSRLSVGGSAQRRVSGGDWTSDSENDSSPSPSENSFTSDTDISSSR